MPVLLCSLASQTVKPHEVIVLDDASTDRTAEIARQHGAEVIASQPLPPGWRGKTWACYQGAQAATGDWLLFLDADTWLEQDGLARVLSAYSDFLAIPREGLAVVAAGKPGRSSETLRALQGGAFSIGPYHAVRRLYEQLSLFFNLCMTVSTVPDRLFGQMLLVDRPSYFRIGGHEAVKGRTLENFHLAQLFHDAGIPTRSAVGRGILAFRMYPNGLRELIEGWTKGFASGAGRTSRGVLGLVVAWMIGLMLAPFGWLVTGDGLPWGGAYLLCAAQVIWFARAVGSFHWLAALLYPGPLIFFFAVVARSAMRSGKEVTWKGRTIRAD